VSHTAHLAGDDGAYQALFERHGVTRARDQQEMVDLAMAFSRCALPAGDRIGIVTLSGGAGTWLTDALIDERLQVPTLDEATQRLVRELIPPYGSSANPIDVTAQVVGAHGALSELIELALHSPQLDAVVLITTLAGTRLLDRERDRLEPLLKAVAKPLLVYSYAPATPDSVDLMAEFGLAWYTSPRRVARVLRALVDYARARAAPRPPAEVNPGGRAPGRVRAADGTPLLEHECKRLLSGWGLTVPKGTFVTSVDGLHAAARTLAPPLCLKAQARTLIHKTDAGAVALDLADAEAVVVAARAMRERLPVAPDGYLVEEMAAPGVEMIAGALVDPDLGPFVLAGTGGIYAEILDDVSLCPAPVSEEQALELIDGLRGAALLSGARGRRRADRVAFARCLVALGQFVACHEEQVREIDLNPVLVGPEGHGACVVDAAIIPR
jgi:acyl-CoA synthetase (NDP forming)